MHIEFLIEDSSGAKLINSLLPEILGAGTEHTWRTHEYKGIGRIQPNLGKQQDPAKRHLLDQLRRLLAGYGRTPGIDAVVVVVDSDSRDPRKFKAELRAILNDCKPAPNALFQLATEEVEAWLLGDRDAILHAYPKAKIKVLNSYEQDSVCGTWELLADAIFPGGSPALKQSGWPLKGTLKHEWVEKISPHMKIEENLSPSFREFRDNVRNLSAQEAF